MKKYCIYFPYRLDINELKSVKEYDQLFHSIKNYLIQNDSLDDNLITIKKFIRYNQEQELSLLAFDKKIYAIIFSRDGYKPFNILPIINDLEHNQCFLAISLDWIEFADDDFSQERIQSIYDNNRNRLIPLIEHIVEKLLTEKGST